jgi:LacI family transcriptional regulator
MDHLRRSVVLLIDSSTSWGSYILQGVARYAERYGPWSLYLGQHGKYESLSLPRVGGLDGCIARLTSAALAEEVRAAGLPAVNVSWSRHGGRGIAVCTSDGGRTGTLAADYFLERGHSRFGYYGPPPSPDYQDLCRTAFGDALKRAGHPCSVFEAPRTAARPDWVRLREGLAAWLLGLEKPAAVLTFDSLYGREVTEACVHAGLRVPVDVSVLAGEHDELFSSIAVPRLSTIDLSPWRIGYEAAGLLDRLMAVEPPPAPVLIPPAGVRESQSTSALAIRDPLLREALHYIRTHAAEPIQVADVVRHVAASRRLLEYRFRSFLGCSPADEIRRARLERARQLLGDRDLPIQAVAERCGFRHPEVFARSFRRAYGVTPSDYRSREGA